MSQTRDKNILMVCENTGEVLWKGDIGSFQTKKQREMALKETKRISKNTPKFNNTNMDGINFISSVLTPREIGYLVLLQPYLDYEKGLIKSNEGGKLPLATKDMIRIVGLNGKSNSSFYKFRKKCLINGIMIHDKESKRYFINNKFMFKGAFKGMRAVSASQKEGKEEYPKMKPEDLSIIFKLQKFINKSTMALVHNPEELDDDKLKFMKLKDIADELGYTPQYLSSKLYSLKIKDEALVARIKVSDQPAKYMMNPRYFWRGDYASVKEKTVNIMPYFKINS